MRRFQYVQLFTLLITLLILITPTSTLTQDAKTEAEIKAEYHVNERLWFAIGALTPIIPAVVGCYFGAIIDPAQLVYENNGTSFCLPNSCLIIGDITSTSGMAIGSSLGILGATGATYAIATTGSPKPLPDTFIGKSPEYIQAYTDAYQKKTNKLQAKWTLIGSGCSFIGITMMLISLQQ